MDRHNDTKAHIDRKLPKFPILMYHEVSDANERSRKTRHKNPAYRLSAGRFREQMEHIHRNGYETRSLGDLFEGSGLDHQKQVVLTFDDGWENIYTHAFPILAEFGLTATIFVVTEFVGRPNYVSWGNLKEMNQGGISVQSHTASHRPLAGLSPAEIGYELEESKHTVEHQLGTTADFLSVPHGMIDEKVLRVARSVGYKAVCTSEPGFSHSPGNPAVLKRINISNSYDISTFGRILQGNLLSIFPAICAKKTKNLTKKLVGYNNYRKIYDIRYRSRLTENGE